jgi:hypothetical protein
MEAAFAVARRVPLPGRPDQQLIQIRRGYTAVWHDCVLSVESGAQGWTASVDDRSLNHRLYDGHRLNAQAAKSAAVEFALFQKSAAAAVGRPEEITLHLRWTEYW